MNHYRPFQQNDLLTLVSLMSELGYDVGADTLSTRIKDIRKNGGEVIIVDVDKQIMGCINIIIDIRLAEGKAGEIVSLIVTKECRGLGLGKGLVCAAEQWLQGRCEQIRVRANTVRHEAHHFYQALGFETVKSQRVFIKKIKDTTS